MAAAPDSTAAYLAADLFCMQLIMVIRERLRDIFPECPQFLQRICYSVFTLLPVLKLQRYFNFVILYM